MLFSLPRLRTGSLALVGAMLLLPATICAGDDSNLQQRFTTVSDSMPAQTPLAEAPSKLNQTGSKTLPIYVVSDEADVITRDDFCGGESCGTLARHCRGKGCSTRIWARADYLMWWAHGSRPPALITRGSETSQGILGEQGTEILFGDEYVNGYARNGYRIETGIWLNDCHTNALVIDFWDFGSTYTGRAFSSPGDPVLARPFFDTSTQQQNSELVSLPSGPGALAGTVTATVSDYFMSTGVGFSHNLRCWKSCASEAGCCDNACGSCNTTVYRYRWDLLFGYRHFRYNDNLTVHEELEAQGVGAGTTYDIVDSFHTHNDFHGGEIGLKGGIVRGRWSLDLLAKAAFGNNRQVITIDGQTIETPAGGNPFVQTGGLLTSGYTNIGQYQRDDFVVIPQFGFEIGYQLSCRWRALVGYNFLYWANVQRAADQVDFNVDPNNLPGQPGGGPNPAPQLNGSDFWAQGINLGLECRY